MSKSRGNVIAPDKYVKEMGADVVRCYLMFIGPWDQGGEWSDSGLNGIARWLRRVWGLLLRDPNVLRSETASSSEEKDTNRVLHKTIGKVTSDFERFKFNTMIASMMELTNAMSDIWDRGKASKQTWIQLVEIFLKLLAPAAPHLTEELWEKTGHKLSVHKEMWPKYQEALAAEEVITLVVQVDGKVRDRIQVPHNIDQEEAQRLSLESEKVSRHIDHKDVQKFIYVRGRLLNIVTRPK
jgi:leucyl-tRNA synthetase